MEYTFKPEDVAVESWDGKSAWDFSLRMPVGVRVTHLPTGIIITCDTQTTQHSNRHLAFIKLQDRLKAM